MKNTLRYTLLTTTILASNIMASRFDPLEGIVSTPLRTAITRIKDGAGSKVFSTPEEVELYRREGYFAVLSPYSDRIEAKRLASQISRAHKVTQNEDRRLQLQADAETAEEARIRDFNARMQALSHASSAQQEEIARLTATIAELRSEVTIHEQRATDLESQLNTLRTSALETAENLAVAKIAIETKDRTLEERQIALTAKSAEMERAIETITVTTSVEKDALTAQLLLLKAERDQIEAERNAIAESRERNMAKLQADHDKALKLLAETEEALVKTEEERNAKEKALQAFQDSLDARLAAQASSAAAAAALKEGTKSDSEDELDGKRL